MFGIQFDDSMRCGIYCTGFINYIIAGTSLLEYINLISLNDYKTSKFLKL